MENRMTHASAWVDFYNWMTDRLTRGEFMRIPADVQEAKYAFEGKRRYGLGEKRIKALLTKYAPDRYDFLEFVILKAEK